MLVIDGYRPAGTVVLHVDCAVVRLDVRFDVRCYEDVSTTVVLLQPRPSSGFDIVPLMGAIPLISRAVKSHVLKPIRTAQRRSARTLQGVNTSDGYLVPGRRPSNNCTRLPTSGGHDPSTASYGASNSWTNPSMTAPTLLSGIASFDLAVLIDGQPRSNVTNLRAPRTSSPLRRTAVWKLSLGDGLSVADRFNNP